VFECYIIQLVLYMYLENKQDLEAKFVNPLKYYLWIDESRSISVISIYRMTCHVYNISNISWIKLMIEVLNFSSTALEKWYSIIAIGLFWWFYPTQNEDYAPFFLIKNVLFNVIRTLRWYSIGDLESVDDILGMAVRKKAIENRNNRQRTMFSRKEREKIRHPIVIYPLRFEM
jgi:hypothetical protein